MKYLGIESKIDPDHEVEAISKFLDQYWDVKIKTERSVPEVVDYILQAGVKYGIAFKETEVQKAVESYNRDVDFVNKFENGNVDKMEFNRTTSDDDIEGYFPGQAGLVETVLKKEWKVSAKPKDYNAFKKAKGVGEDEELEFDGAKLHNKIDAVSFSFVNSLKRRTIYSTEVDHGRSPLTELVGAVFRQGVNIAYHLVDEKWGTPIEIEKKADKFY